jgi:hypothetical protein
MSQQAVSADSIPNSVPEIIDPVFAKTTQNARFLLSENERFGLVFVKTGSINSGTDVGMFSPETDGTKTKAARVLTGWLPTTQMWKLMFAHLATVKSSNS